MAVRAIDRKPNAVTLRCTTYTQVVHGFAVTFDRLTMGNLFALCDTLLLDRLCQLDKQFQSLALVASLETVGLAFANLA